MNNKRNIRAIVIIASIVILVGFLMGGLFYLWSKDCEGQIVYGAKTSSVTKCN